MAKKNFGIAQWNPLPCHVCPRICPSESRFQNCFLDWVKSIGEVSEGEVIAIDGKTLRQSYDKTNEKGAIQMVSAWATSNRLVLGQYKVESKSNEITAIPKLLKMLACQRLYCND